MKFTKVDYIPGITRRNSKMGEVQIFIEEFYNSGIKMAKVDIEKDRFKTTKNAQNTFILRNKRMGKLPVKTIVRGDVLYIVRTDMK